ncbi:NT-C2 domain-containing protein [Cephalotus follicularis]|uniref:NT-C2 domain-containing protein n=1 Tax=Cephalotus follicularis TaxID=3775 RepID=A0A1Q3D5N5_CEPFO|nr:NT-C2 domain-containing protein [Cephalotus follicularis]
MVLGLRSKNKKGTSVQLDYLIHVQVIKPWPPSQSLRSAQSVLLHWEYGDQSSGSFTSFAGDGEIEFSDSFRLLVTLCQESSRRGTLRDGFQKNCLDFTLYEPRKDKGAKGQLLGSAIINLADYGIIKESIHISEPIHLKKSSKNMGQPVLYLDIQPFGIDSYRLLKEVSFEQDGSKSVSEVQNVVDDVESEIASFTDDDNVSSRSSQTISSSTLETATGSSGHNDKNGSALAKDGIGRVNGEHSPSPGVVAPMPEVKMVAEAFEPLNGSLSPLSSMHFSSDLVNPVNNLPPKVVTSDSNIQAGIILNHVSNEESQPNQKDNKKGSRCDKIGQEEVSTSRLDVGLLEGKERNEQQKLDEQIFEVKNPLVEVKSVDTTPQGATIGLYLRSKTFASSRAALGVKGGMVNSHKLKDLKSVQSNSDTAKSNELSSNSHFMQKAKEIDTPEDIHNAAVSYALNEREETMNDFFDEKVKLESKIEMLEEELRETAAIEVGLYSVVAEHGSSTNKIHAPARRLSRFYLQTFKTPTTAKWASAARAVLSGLVLVSKACGNDVPRLTFWLSNSIVLRAIVSQAVEKLQEVSAELSTKNNDDWVDPQTFVVALEKVEAWIFSRIVESVWWQTLTPHMQTAAANGSSSRKSQGRRNQLGNQDQGNFSIELWKKAFKDACERLCPSRAGGHEYGCLPVIAKLVMEQLVSRLDVAMFNAILRESAGEMPTDPVSDPISDSMVLPIPAGKSSFGAGEQLKNAVGNWARWLSDLFGIDDNDSPEDKSELADDKSVDCESSFKAFHLLNALSDAMMLPLEMLAEETTRKEVFPMFGAPVIKRILENFVPDEFSPDPIPVAVLEALDSEELPEAEEEASITSIPCISTPTVYSPPPAASLTSIIGEVGSQPLLRSASAVLKKPYTSDDELDELDSPINFIFIDNSRLSPTSTASNWIPRGNGGRKVVRYQLLQEVWRDSD